jgi:uncharacterized protein
MKLDLDRTAAGRSELELAGEVRLGLPEGGPDRTAVSGSLTVDHVSRRFLLGGTLTATARATCGRCLEEFDCTWDAPVEIQVLLDAASDEGEGDTLVIRQSRGEVDLHEPLRELLMLAFPLAPVCREDCRGLCAACGIDRNRGTCTCAEEDHDPRWDGLP